jgi:hypothetical protein
MLGKPECAKGIGRGPENGSGRQMRVVDGSGAAKAKILHLFGNLVV